MRQIKIEDSTVTILTAVKGLVSEADAVKNAVERITPDVIAVSISKEELAGLKEMEPGEEVELNDIELVYAAMMETFGEVSTPSPYLTAALECSKEKEIPILPLDMNDEVYTEAYCRNVKTMEMLKESRRAKSLMRRKKRFDYSSPLAFVKSWDAVVNKSEGFRTLEKERELHMASSIKAIAKIHSNILAIIEAERADAVASLLSEGNIEACQDLSEVIELKEAEKAE